jgi:Cu-processing system ATP-binding protein
MIVLQNLIKRFGPLTVLKGLDLHIPVGRVTGVIGHNGSGKTTLMKIILGLVKPNEGTVTVHGQTLNGDWSYRRFIGYMPQITRFPDNLTPRELLDLVRDLRQDADIDHELFEAFQLAPDADRPVRTLSGGTRQKVNATIAFSFSPRLLLLDEPTAGLDPVATGILKERIHRARDAGATIVMTSHILSDIDELCDDLVFMSDGRIRFKGPASEIKHSTGHDVLERAVAQLMIESDT